ncbi:MAG: FecR domain-containing protein, partial [Pirellulaceae bacterium]|nr:FecR domain-containing protein [Pirellulaceae bacterium]
MTEFPYNLIHAYIDGELTADARDALLKWLRSDRANVAQFVAECRLHSELCDKQWNAELAAGGTWTAEQMAAVEARDSANTVDAEPEPPLRPVIVLSDHSARAAEPFVGGFVFSYMVASVFMCLLLLGFWAYKLPSNRSSSIASSDNSRRSTTSGEESFHNRPAPVFVGRITGIAGAKWSDEPNYIAPIGVRVALGRTYKLKSGLLEITYDSGARVILQGPCSYEVDSTAGGYLALGKLTARIGERGEGRGERGGKAEGGKMKDEGGRPNAASLATSYQPLATNPSPLSPPPSPLFTVRTPSAVVTDLGTEFGVEVTANGDTTSYVFQGMVVVQAGILGVGDAGMRDSDKRP